MKFKSIACLVIISFCSLTMQSCIGKFALTKRLHTWNQHVSSNKWVNEIIFLVLVIIPVYAISLILVDGLVLNTIEFWSGSNPLAMKPGEVETQYASKDGVTYEIEASQNRFHITQTEGPNTGESVDLVYDTNASTWSFENGKENHKVMQILNSGDVKIFDKNGKEKIISRETMDRAVLCKSL